MSEEDKELELPAEAGKAYADPSETYPRKKYFNVASTNLAARGLETNELYVAGGEKDLNLDLVDLPASEYPMNQVRETITGHVTEMDDTPGRERMLFKHRTGTGIDMRPDGTMIISTKFNTIHITGNDQKILVSGDGDVVYQGNLKLHVAGDMDVEVGGNYNLIVHGDKREDIRGSYQQKVKENHETSITENKSTFVVGTNTDTVLTDNNLIVKGDHTTRVEKNINQFAGEDTLITSESEFSMSTKNANLAANDMVVQSTTGMIGGDNVFYYAKNYYGTSATFTAGVTAPTFTGDLTGRADEAIASDTANYGPSTGSPAGWTNTNTATDTSIRTSFPAPGPDATWLNDYLTQTGYGYRIVDIDVGDVIKDEIDKSADYNGISKVRLTTENVRSKLRDPNTLRNEKFIGRCMNEGVLSGSYAERKPARKLGRITNNEGTPRRPTKGSTFIGSEAGNDRIVISGNLEKTKNIMPDQIYNPEQQFIRDGEISARTSLAKGIKIAKFLGGHGDPATLNSITDETDRLRIARNLYIHAKFLNMVQEHLNEENRYRLVVSEGFYEPAPGETLEPESLNSLMAKGQCVVYQLRDRNGLIPVQATYDTAEFIMDFCDFDRMILSYDTYNTDGTLHAEIIVTMPDCLPTWEVTFKNNVETRFNNNTQTNGELVEIIE